MLDSKGGFRTFAACVFNVQNSKSARLNEASTVVLYQPLGRKGCARETGKSRAMACRFREIRTKTKMVAR